MSTRDKVKEVVHSVEVYMSSVMSLNNSSPFQEIEHLREAIVLTRENMIDKLTELVE